MLYIRSTKNYSMKKLLSIFLLSLIFNQVKSQAIITIQAPPANSTSQLRAPNGTSQHAGMKACYLILQPELSVLTGSVVNGFGFDLLNGTSSIPVTGNFTVYLQNTSDTFYNKGTSYSGALTGMTAYCATVMTIPVSATSTSIMITLSSNFTYTGGGIYVAFEWTSNGSFDLNPATYNANYISGGQLGATSFGASYPAANLMTSTDFRPAFFLRALNTATNELSISNVSALGKIAKLFNALQVITTQLKNSSTISKTNFSVNLSVTGANPFTSTVVVPTIAAGATVPISFPGFVSTNNGINNIFISIPNDQVSSNNTTSWTQSVNCNAQADGPPLGTYSNGIGFGAGSGCLVNKISIPTTASLSGVNVAISSDVTGLGGQLCGVLLDASGNLLSYSTNTITLASTSYIQKFNFNPIALTANTNYHVGMAQLSATMYPYGAEPSPFNQPTGGYFSSATTGGTLFPVTTFGYFGIDAIYTFSTITAIQSQTVSCGNASFAVSGNGASAYTWTMSSGGNFSTNQNSITVSPTISNGILNFTVNGLDASGCVIGTALTSHSVSPGPNISITPSKTTFCQNESGLLFGFGGVSYTWQPGITGQSYSLTNTTAGVFQYTVLGENGGGCQKTASVTINVNPSPNINIFTPKLQICKGEPIVISGLGAASYQWYDAINSNVVGVSITVTLLPTSSTIYNVVGTGTNSCTGSKTFTITVDQCTGFVKNNFESNDFQILPNPSNGVFYLDSKSDAEVLIYDLTGKIIFSQAATKGKTQLEINQHPSGIYFVEINSSNKKSYIKLIKE
jgi:hypothetical protein